MSAKKYLVSNTVKSNNPVIMYGFITHSLIQVCRGYFRDEEKKEKKKCPQNNIFYEVLWNYYLRMSPGTKKDFVVDQSIFRTRITILYA